MITIYRSNADGILENIDSIEQGSWINMVDPSKEEILLISQRLNIPQDFIPAALDEEEGSRIEFEDNATLVIVDIPFTEIDDNSLTYDTYPLAIIYTENIIITVCLKNSPVLLDFAHEKVPSFYTFKKVRFMLQILYRISNYYLLYLRQINKKSLLIEKTLYKSLRNRELIQLFALQKSLVYFSTSLKSNDLTLEKLLKQEILTKYDEDRDILEDVIIENKQAIEMCSIYDNVLQGTMNVFASIISNNQNQVMKYLTSVTIVISIPTLISGMLGMNVGGIPFFDHPNGFFNMCLIVTLITIGAIMYLSKKDMF
ncbi:MAG: magnesium transporter CorA family protein [Clostridium sp.]|uniref:magnesium transporter CorA family protein n=1 Tax=Clostridium culturomicium TaxID=1499683 RepID=UPI0005911390|nr:magnesium transporter CorA family protein [Clostridium culturomicium]MDU4892732.1 magnesium transporter CorA family protein [Clostridium sp.]MDU7082057.1 magnesium transporter CorA family protein [Clostridium sp.]